MSWVNRTWEQPVVRNVWAIGMLRLVDFFALIFFFPPQLYARSTAAWLYNRASPWRFCRERRSMRARLTLILMQVAVLAAPGLAQTPTGVIAGTVTDPSGAVIPQARITASNTDTGLSRTLLAESDGTYTIAGLPAGTYQVVAEAPGMRRLMRLATVETGMTTAADLRMQLGSVTENITVNDAAPLLKYESYKIDGVVTRIQIESLPLNGRDFLQLAMLEPGVTVAPNGALLNRQFSVSIMGAEVGRNRVSVDGGSSGGPQAAGFSEEVVQEFQISTVNFDLSTGLGATGAINIVTRSGGNQFRGAAYFFFRDHNMAAYPGLSRDPLSPHPFFARRQPGFSLGGPIRKDRLFFFTNFEHNNQDSVFPVQPRIPEFAGFGGVFPSPYTGKRISTRFDWRARPNHNVFLVHA